MEEIGLVGDLAVVAAAALVGGVAARLLKLPTVLGYLAAGILIGPHTPGPSGDITEVQTIADLGVALLMFTLGIQFSLRELREFRAFALGAGVAVTAAMVGIGAAAATAAGLSGEEAIVAGMATSVSSSMVALRLMEDRGLIGATPGRLTIVVSLVQDISVILMLTTIPALSGDSEDVPRELLLAVLTAAALLAGLILIGIFVLPRVLERTAVSRSRELFLLTVVALALVTASVSAEAGLSLAFGAFLAGILISESEYAHRTLVEVFPLREVFAVVFFVAVGMLFDPDVFTGNLELVLALAVVGSLVKIALIGGVTVFLRFPLRTALATAVAMATMGEFSFVIAAQGLEEGVISAAANDAILASVLLTMGLAPVLFMAHERALTVARRAPLIGAAIRPRTDAFLPEETALVNHAIVVGYTTAGREVASALALRGFRYAVIDEDPLVFRQLREAGVPVVLGDAALPVILEQAGVEQARVLAITVLDPGQVESIAAAARRLNRRLDVIARGITDDAPERLRRLGVARVVEAEFEVGMQFVRHTLQRFGLTSQEVQALLLALRRDRFGEAEERAGGGGQGRL